MSYENAAKDVEVYTGIKVSAKTQQRIVHRYQFPQLVEEKKLQEISLDGGKVRLRTEIKGESCVWKDYKAICVNQQNRQAWFWENEQLIDWVNQQEFSELLTCLGDGHSGMWNIFKQIHPTGNKQEILDWYDLIENLHKVGGSVKRLEKAESLLWQGKVDETLALISPLSRKEAQNFCAYLETHRHRIVNYQYYQEEEISSIASGALESTVKQIDRRLKISGAQWKAENVPQVLKHRCAYINDCLL